MVLQVGQRDPEGVGRVGQRGFIEPEPGADHKSDLLFVGGAFSNHRLFHPFRGILENRQSRQAGRQNGRRPGRPERDRGTVGLDINHRFHRAGIRPEPVDDVRDALVGAGKAFGLPEAGRVLDHPVFQHRDPVARARDHSVTGATKGWIDAEYGLHPRILAQLSSVAKPPLTGFHGRARRMGVLVAVPPRSPVSLVSLSLGVSRAILRTRVLRRKFLFFLTLGLMAAVALGSLLMEKMEQSPLVFLIYWAGVAFGAVGVFLLALYDLFAVRRESR